MTPSVTALDGTAMPDQTHSRNLHAPGLMRNGREAESHRVGSADAYRPGPAATAQDRRGSSGHGIVRRQGVDRRRKGIPRGDHDEDSDASEDSNSSE